MLIDTHIGSADIESIGLDPGVLVASPYPDLIGCTYGVIPLVLIIEIKEQLVAWAVIGKIEGHDEAVGCSDGGIMRLVQRDGGYSGPGKARIHLCSRSSIVIAGIKVATIIPCKTHRWREIFSAGCCFKIFRKRGIQGYRIVF